MICFPNAKINLGLSVTEKRTDGLHNIETCILPIPFYDILEISQSDKFILNIFGKPIEGCEYENLIVKTWHLLLSIKKDIPPVEVCLYKNIPAGAGLGGGSSDAAFFIKAINSYYSLGFSNNYLSDFIKEIGSDCPFFIESKPVIATETGSILTPIDYPVSNMYLTIVFPNIKISTKKAYSNIRPRNKQVSITNALKDICKWKDYLKNDFEDNIFKEFPECEHIKTTLYNKGVSYASLTGTGSAIYAISSKIPDVSDIKNKYAVWSTFIS